MFMILSAFGMCCGYYEKFRDNNIDIDYFYKRRYSKMLPFFSFLMIIAFVMEHSLNDIFEEFMELTMLFGYLPSLKMSVMGISWTLGTIFVFYFMFPFFTTIISTKKKAIIYLFLSLVVNFVYVQYFSSNKFVVKGFEQRHTFLYALPFFMLGGVIYKHRDDIYFFVSKYKYGVLLVGCIGLYLYYAIPTEFNGISIQMYKQMFLMLVWISYAIGSNGKVLSNKYLKVISSISMEMYLSQMIIFRVLQSLNLLYLFGYGWISYITAFILEIIFLVLFISMYKFIYKKITKSFVRIYSYN